MLINSALISASEYLIHFFQKCRRGTKICSQTWISYLTYSLKTGKCWNQIDQESDWNRILILILILILTLWLVTPPCFLPKISQIVQKVIVFFPERWEEIEPWFWHIWIAQWMKFSSLLLIFFDFGHLQRETRAQSWNKTANSGYVLFL